MSRLRVDHVILCVEDLDRSIDFYRNVVGMELKFHDAAYAEFVTEGTKFGLFPRSSLSELLGSRAAADRPEGEILFLVEDAAGEADRLRAAGASILSGPVDRPWGHRTVHVLDPEGHVVEFAQEIPRQRPRASGGDE